MELLLRFLFVFFLSFFITFYLVPLFSKVALKFGIVDCPDGRLKRHKYPTPYLGGMAIFLGFLVSISLVLPFEHQFFLFIFASILLLFIGLFDDLIVLTPAQKFFGQFVAVLCYLKSGFYLKVSFFSNFWNIGLSAFWFLLFINAFNLIDIMDGLAVTIAIGMTVSYLIFSIIMHNYIFSLLLLALLGSLCAFFWFNKPQARIYLGDSGSLFIGGFLASMPFAISWSEYNESGYFIPLIISAIPLVEIGTLILVRTYKKIPFFFGSPDHFAIFLQEKGWSKYKILFLCFLLSFLFLLFSLLFFYLYINLAFLLHCCIVFAFLWFLSLV